MAKFLITSETSSCLENIIREAKKTITLVSPYLQISKTLLERLKDASIKEVEIIIIYGKDELNTSQKESLAQLKNLKLYFLKNLHAKCYFNEKEMVITSMNMYEYSAINNREIGILINAIHDKEIYEDAINETNSIITHSIERSFNKKNDSPIKKDINNEKRLDPIMGYCIRCKASVVYDPERPYCLECFTSWVTIENNIYFKEVLCHCCGTDTSRISMNEPQCRNCRTLYRENRIQKLLP